MYQPRDFQQQIRRTMIMYLHCFFLYKWAERYLSQKSAPDLGGPKGPGPRVPHQEGAPTMFMCLTIHTTCACHLVIFISEESLFVDAIKLSVVQTAVFHLNIIWYCDETTTTLIVFLKVGQVSKSSECKAKPRRTHYLTSLRVTGRFCVCLTHNCAGRTWVALLSRATIRALFGVAYIFNVLMRNEVISEDVQNC